MLVKNKKSGDVEAMRHGAAVDAVTAGTHSFVNVEENDKGEQVLKDEKAKAAKTEEGGEPATVEAVRPVPNAPSAQTKK